METGMVTIEQVMLPFAQNKKVQPLYEGLLQKKFAGPTNRRELASSYHESMITGNNKPRARWFDRSERVRGAKVVYMSRYL